MKITISACKTAWGWVGTVVSTEGVLGTTLPANSPEQALAPLLAQWPSAQEGMNSRLIALHEKLRCYFRGESVDFANETLDMRETTEFQARVWQIVRSIPWGQVRSYSWVAQQMGSPRNARAVGQAIATNPFPVVVPCHRVVGRVSQLTGFSGGLLVKRRLLELEGIRVAGEAILTATP